MKVVKKILQDIQESLPGKRVYFIYTHRNGFDRFHYGLKANTEISYWNYQALKSHFSRVTFLKLENESPKILDKITSQDVVIGHIGETFKKASNKTRRMIAFYPWCGHNDRSENPSFNCLPKEIEWEFLDLAQSIILLTSEYNVLNYIHTPSNFWYDYFRRVAQNKTLRFVHQPIDLELFQRVKHEYHSSDFLYIGNNAHMKCLEDSKKLVSAALKRFHIYGVGHKRVDNLDFKLIKQIADQADFFIQPGMWEGQCVAILEAAARGFIPLVSRETGYPYDHPYLLRYNDFEYNILQIKKVLALRPEEKKDLADHLYQQLCRDKNHNDWSQLTAVLVEEIKKMFVNCVSLI